MTLARRLSRQLEMRDGHLQQEITWGSVMSKLPLSLVTALRFSRGRRRTGMVSLVSIVSTLGIVLGVAVIIGLSAMNGFERELNNRVLSVVPHGQIFAVKPPYKDLEFAEQVIRKRPV